jgi:hypothetical protein
MSSNFLSKLLRAAVIAAAVVGIFICAVILPMLGKSFSWWYPDYAHAYVPWLIFIWIAALPVFAVMMLVWKAADAVGKDRAFSAETARLVMYATILILCDTAFFCIGNMVLLLLKMNHPAIVLASLFICVLGFSLAAITAVLSRHITKAAALQEEVDGTI